MPELRVLDRITRKMQRLGYLKRLVWRVSTSSTSSLEVLGSDLLDTVTRRVSVTLNEDLAQYIKARLFDKAYTSTKKAVNGWAKNGGEPPIIAMELQDIYLSDSTLPSGVGKLVRDDWHRYPQLAVYLGFVREGTFSANTRGYSLLYFTDKNELKAFSDYLPADNPIRISQAQGLLLLYAFLENDGEVVIPFWQKLLENYETHGSDETPRKFSDREAGDYLPEIYRKVIASHRARILTADVRERLTVLEKSAESIARQRGVTEYTGGTAREEAVRLRLEPYVDMGLLSKPDRYKYEYNLNPVGLAWAKASQGFEGSQEVEAFLSTRFFATAAQAWGYTARTLNEPDEIVPHLQRAWKAISSSSGYAPIEEMAVVAGIDGLLKEKVIIEHTVAKQALIAFQKANPYMVRFTVDRFGALAHAKFLETPERL